jgi:hypothetical protein
MGLDNGWSKMIDKEQKDELNTLRKESILLPYPSSGPRHSLKIEKKTKSSENLNGYLIHYVTTQLAACGDYIHYVLMMENSRTGSTWQIKRRYSLFLDLHKTLEETFEVPHCHYCKDISTKLEAITFPQKKMFNTNEVIKQRVIEFQAYVIAVLKMATNPFHRNCSLVSCDVNELLSRFLTLGRNQHINIMSNDKPEYSVPCLLREMKFEMKPPVAKKLKNVYPRLVLEPILEMEIGASSISNVC